MKHVERGPGHGNLTNIIKMRKVWMVLHSEGVGTEESPMREIRTFFDEDGKYILRDDPFKGHPQPNLN